MHTHNQPARRHIVWHANLSTMSFSSIDNSIQYQLKHPITQLSTSIAFSIQQSRQAI